MGLSEKNRKKSLRYSVLDGIFYSIMFGFGDSFFSPLGVFLNANNIELGFLSSLPPALGSLSQLLSNKLTSLFKSRKYFISSGVVLQALMYIPIAFTVFLGDFRVLLLIMFVSLYALFGSIFGPAWSSWMGDLVKEKERGSYFGNRNRICGLFTFGAFLLAGFLLQYFKDNLDREYMGFILIFLVALVARMISFSFLMRKSEPRFVRATVDKLYWRDFFKRVKNTNYGIFVIFLCLMNFSVNLASPFFTPFWLNDLKWDYLTFTFVTAVALIVKFLFMPVWGKAADKYGTRKVLTLTGFLMPMTPLFWVFSQNIIYVIFIQMYSGFVWAGFELSAFNFIFDITEKRTRSAYITYFNVLNGIACLLGGTLGGIIVRSNHLFWSQYILVIIISCVARYLVALVFIPRLKEVRQVEHISYRNLLMRVLFPAGNRGPVINFILPRLRKKRDEEKS
ncbi:MAG: MFS transporter [Spirochaetales bacterium]|nr:MFS transporter [Spirochaetales bacterium]